MEALEAIIAQTAGAAFYRADLHIHSFGGSHDVSDASMTPEAIVDSAATEGLSLISITDHNEISNVEAALNASLLTSVTVIPGVELSTGQGHLLCYLPSIDSLRRFHAQLAIVDRAQQTSRCQQSILECLNLLGPLGGYAVLAHVDIPSGFEAALPGGSPHKADVLCHPALLGMELKHANSNISYSDLDPDPIRAGFGRERVRRLRLGWRQQLARVLNSDAHALDALGRNAAHSRSVTRYKMDAPSFEGLRIALEDGEARVRIEDQVPATIPRILGARLDGGFLSGQAMQFSPNLNCIIGGRGTGKSTVFECVRCLSESRSESKVVDSEVWPEDLCLFFKDQAGITHTLRRQKDGEIQNVDDPGSGPRDFPIDCFGQGEAARISIEAQSDPLALLRYLDRFVDLSEALAAENAARSEVDELRDQINEADQKVQLIPQYERQLATTKLQLAALQKPEVAELITLQRQLATEREVRRQIANKLDEAKRAGAKSPKVPLNQIPGLADPSKLAVGGPEFRLIVEGARSLESTIIAAEASVASGMTTFELLVQAQTELWRGKETEAQGRVDQKRRELEALNISFDMSYISKLAKDEATHQQSVTNLKAWKPHLQQLRKQRALALGRRWTARERVASLRDAFGRHASDTLQRALSELQVSLKYTRNAYSPAAAERIIEVMGWRTNQQPRAAWLVEKLTIPRLLEAIDKNDTRPITDLRTAEGVEVFKRDEAKQIIQRLSEPATKSFLESAEVHDLPRLNVSRSVPDGKGGHTHITREFTKLSLGQQQSVLLALLLSSDSNAPLIIDQPEDNLDGQFIYATLVPVLRQAKERRQVIVVTHNPNVAVLGDAELILVMKAKSDRGEIVARGSIDNPSTRDSACAILEGAQEAFLRRAKMYGIKVGDPS